MIYFFSMTYVFLSYNFRLYFWIFNCVRFVLLILTETLFYPAVRSIESWVVSCTDVFRRVGLTLYKLLCSKHGGWDLLCCRIYVVVIVSSSLNVQNTVGCGGRHYERRSRTSGVDDYRVDGVYRHINSCFR